MANAVIFDKDGVIFETRKLYLEMWSRTFARFNKQLTPEIFFKELSGRSYHENVRIQLKPDISDAELNVLIAETVAFITDNYGKYVRPVPGVVNFLKKLKISGIPVALATSSRQEITRFGLDFFKLEQYFASVVTAADIAKAKPDPEIFLKAAANLNKLPAECAVFEDSYSGVKAANSAGMKVILVMTAHTKKEIPDVDLAIPDFREITLSDLKLL